MKRLEWFLFIAFAMTLITTFISPINSSTILVGDIGPPDAQLVPADIVAPNDIMKIVIADVKLIGPAAVTMPEVMGAGTWSGSAAQVGNELDEPIMGLSLDTWEDDGTITIEYGTLATPHANGEPQATLMHKAMNMATTSSPAARTSTVFNLTTTYTHPNLGAVDGQRRSSLARTETTHLNRSGHQIDDHLLR